MCSRCDVTSVDTLALLSRLGASPWLVRHHELVLEAAVALCDELARHGVPLDRSFVLAGAALHDAGKIVHPEEQHAPGHEHEAAGQVLLGEAGVSPQLARVCVTHASWDAPDRTLEDLVVALADKLWKGKRVDDLERLVVARVARSVGRSEWDVFAALDATFEAVAAAGPDRLARSHI